jgi:hypothetical protein
MSGEQIGDAQEPELKPVRYDVGIVELFSASLVQHQSASIPTVRKDGRGVPVEWRLGQEPTGNELCDVARAIVSLPRVRRQEQVEQGRRIRLARRMVRMPLGSEVTAKPGRKKPRNPGDSTQAAHEVGIAQASSESLKKYANWYGVEVEWLVTGDYLGYQGNISTSSIINTLTIGHSGIFFLDGCFPNQSRWKLDRVALSMNGYRILSPAWLDPWLVCSLFLGRMHRSEEDFAYKTTEILKDISESLKEVKREMRYLRPINPLEQDVVPDAE